MFACCSADAVDVKATHDPSESKATTTWEKAANKEVRTATATTNVTLPQIKTNEMMEPNDSTIAKKVESCYPGAIINADLAKKVKETLASHGYGETSLLATSLCCDEVNRELEIEFGKSYGDNFSMGGLAGFAFGGITSFGAMAHHIPTNGSCLIVYGPHVGIDADGTVGKVNRRGRDSSGACCGSATAAAGYVELVNSGEEKKTDVPDDIEDAQQMWVGDALLPYADRLRNAADPSTELPLALFDSQDELMKTIVSAGCQEVAGEGLIALLGGIQINTPAGMADYFLPKIFELRNNKNELVASLINTVNDNAPVPSIVTVTETIKSSYPGALSNAALSTKVKKTLASHGYGETSLLATSLCCDEVNRELEIEFGKSYGDNFSMGGLAGFAFGGITSFGAMAHHIPTNGSCLIVYGPHVGIDADGTVGKVNRRGRDSSGACCGSATAAAGYVELVNSGEEKKTDVPDDIEDAQQMWVGDALLPYADRLRNAADPSAELPLALFDSQDELMKTIVSAGCQEVAGEGLIALLGGIQINTPAGMADYFLPKIFELRNNKNELVASLINTVNDNAPVPSIVTVTETIKSSYPGALSNAALSTKVKKTLASHGYGETSLLATSLCCDEVNRELEIEFGKSYGDNFSMGGLAGFAFGGITSFGAMAHHIPTNGSCLIVYGPHVGIDADGTVGKVNRRGRDSSGACCGSATAAAGYVELVNSGEEKKTDVPDDIEDAQQMWVGDALLPYADRLRNAADPSAELPLALFDSQDELMKTIVSAGCQEVAGEGLIALLGGIQINTPAGMADYFLPKIFELRNNKNELVASLINTVNDNAPVPSIVTVTETIKSSYPGALSNAALSTKVKKTLASHGYGETSLLATSLCCDEVNRELEIEFGKSYGDNFSMGGLAGFAFGGITSFGAMAHHIPTNGSCLIVYGPHVGIDADGTVGKVNRRGRDSSGACCGSATAAAGYVELVNSGEEKKTDVPDDIEDAQQMWVGDALLPYADRLRNAADPSAELPLALFDSQDELMKTIVSAGCQEVAGEGLIALLGGIQINTPAGMADYFLPKIFELRNNKNELVASLINTVNDNAPVPSIVTVTETIKSSYPGALSNAALSTKVKKTLASHGYGETSLLATSLCCDEVNRELEIEFGKSYGDNFSMGGLAGFAFGGITSFGAMAHHIPTNGSCLIVYGPHVGIDADGTVGKVNRRGRDSSGACCGSATAAAGYVELVNSGEEKKTDVPDDIEDAQQMWVGDALLPYADRLRNAADPSAELPLALFDSQDELMKTIVSAGCQEVAGEGLIALLGGIQINTPAGMADYFLPKVFELRTNKNFSKNVISTIDENLIGAPTILKEAATSPEIATISDLVQLFYPGALSNSDLATKVKTALGTNGYGETTLLATSLCCDEVNRELETEFCNIYGDNFSMGGLAGFAFGGVTSFGAMAHHIPANGSCLIIYGPHVGIDADGVVGKVNRRGRTKSGPCCGSATAAAGYVQKVNKGEATKEKFQDDIVDAQQMWVGDALLTYADRLENSVDPAAELPRALFDCQDEYMKEIVSVGCREVAGKGLIALLGGIQINTPEGEKDYFLPMVFELRNNKNRKVKSLLFELK